VPFEKPLPTHLSPSRLQDYRSCPRKFQHGAVERIPQPATYAATKGRLVHHALESLHRLAAPERTRSKVRYLLDEAETAILTPEVRDEIGLDDAKAATMRAEGERAMANYFTMEDPTTVEHQGVELKLEARVDGVPLLGILDRLDREGDEVVVVDYKTGAVPDRRFDAQTFHNAEIYAALVEATSGALPSRLRLMYLSRGDVLERLVSPVVVGARREAAARAWREIEDYYAAGEFPATPSANACRFCSYRQRCLEAGVAVPAPTRRP
jgi:putative RecB family exonuclease